MSIAQSASQPDTSQIGPLLRGVRWLVLWSIGCALVYAVFSTASRGGCAGGLDSAGGFVDIAGRPTDIEPMCYSVQLGPNPIVLAAIALIVVWHLRRAERRAVDVASVDRILNRAGLIVLAVALGSIAIGQIWFWMLPVDDWASGGAIVFPFPFASVSSELTPLTQR